MGIRLNRLGLVLTFECVAARLAAAHSDGGDAVLDVVRSERATAHLGM